MLDPKKEIRLKIQVQSFPLEQLPAIIEFQSSDKLFEPVARALEFRRIYQDLQ